MYRKYKLLLMIFVIFLVACGGAASEPLAGSLADDGERGFYAEEPANPDSVGESEPTAAALNTTQTNFNQTQPSQPQERLIIRTGNLDIVVEDTEASMVDIGRLVEQLDGWIVTSEIRQRGDDTKSGTITLRVPAEEYDELVNRIKEMALEVTWESSSSQDVTEEYVDLSSRLGNLEATADRVRAFLDEAQTVEEALEVNQELSRLEGEIEVIKGRMQFLSQSAAFSTLTVSLTPDEIAQPIEVAGWRPEGTAKNAIETLVQTLLVIADVGIVLFLYFLPLALLFGIPGVLVFRASRNWYRRRRELSQETAPQTAE